MSYSAMRRVDVGQERTRTTDKKYLYLSMRQYPSGMNRNQRQIASAEPRSPLDTLTKPNSTKLYGYSNVIQPRFLSTDKGVTRINTLGN